jgi:hypothetical protein
MTDYLPDAVGQAPGGVPAPVGGVSLYRSRWSPVLWQRLPFLKALPLGYLRVEAISNDVEQSDGIPMRSNYLIVCNRAASIVLFDMIEQVSDGLQRVADVLATGDGQRTNRLPEGKRQIRVRDLPISPISGEGGVTYRILKECLCRLPNLRIDEHR